MIFRRRSPKQDLRILVIGAGGHGRVVADLVQSLGHTVVVGDSLRTPEEVADYAKRAGTSVAVVAIGDNATRRRVQGYAERVGLSVWTLIHPTAHWPVHSRRFGFGSVVFAGAVLQVGARIGHGCIVNTRAAVDHDCVLGDFCAVSPGATLGGNVTVGEGAWIGLGACVLHGRSIGAHTVIGAGSVVTRDIPDHVVAYGNPCRVIRPRAEAEPYL